LTNFEHPDSSIGVENGTLKKYARASNASHKAPGEFAIDSQSNIFNERVTQSNHGTSSNNGNSSFRQGNYPGSPMLLSKKSYEHQPWTRRMNPVSAKTKHFALSSSKRAS
jgi:hypothetical protein